MGIGHLLLDGALAVVALWLVAELLLQNRAPLVWRAVALGGFLLVVAGMQLGSVVVIGAGATGFAVGQTFVTLSVKRGRPVGWSLRRPDGTLPGPLAKVPLLAAATGGAAAVAVAEDVPVVGEVGPVEDEPAAVEPVAYEQYQELSDDGVYAEQPAAAGYHPEQQQTYYQPTGYEQQQQWGYYQQTGYEQQYAAQQPYQEPYAQPQPQYQDPYGGQPQDWQYQQQMYPGIPQQPGYGYQPQPHPQPEQQNWDYQQQA